MANHQLLNNVVHKDLKVNNRYGAEFNDNVSTVLTFVTEFGEVAKEYAILFYKNEQESTYQTLALLGIEADENLFLNAKAPNGWQARYVPSVLARGPFLIGYQTDEKDNKKAVIHIDMDNPRINEKVGNDVFLPYGGNSPYLDYISAALQGISEGMSSNNLMCKVFQELDLLTPVSLDIELVNGDKHHLHGHYTIDEEKLLSLDINNLAKLNSSGFLKAAYLIVNSLSNVNYLINIKNKQISENQF